MMMNEQDKDQPQATQTENLSTPETDQRETVSASEEHAGQAQDAEQTQRVHPAAAHPAATSGRTDASEETDDILSALDSKRDKRDAPSAAPISATHDTRKHVASGTGEESSANRDALHLQLKNDEALQREIAEALNDTSIDELMSAAVSGESSTSTVSADELGADVEQHRTARTSSSGGSELGIHRGRISAISGDDVLVELMGLDTGKCTGIVPLKQFKRTPREGSIMDFVVERFEESEGLYILSREGAVTASTWESLQKGSTVEARVVGTNKGGLDLEMPGGIKCFMPISQIDLAHVDDIEQFIAQKLPAVVQEVDRKAKRVVLSRKVYMVKQREAAARKMWDEIAPEQIREGVVRSIKPYGAFVDLGGLDGLLHVSDMSYAHINKPEDVVKVGDNIEVKILKIDREKEKISLGLKQIKPDPWKDITGRFKAGEEISGRVVRTADFGAFIQVEEGIEGLLPISEMSWSRVNKSTDVCKEGDILKLKVLQIDADKHRITLSLKQSQGDPWVGISHKYAVGSVVDAKVTSVTDFGAFVEIETGVEGMVHISELSPKRIGKVTDVVKVGDERAFKVIQVDEDHRRLKLSIKALEESHSDDAQRASAAPPQPPKSHKKPKPANLKGGMGKHGGMGIGLGDLKL